MGSLFINLHRNEGLYFVDVKTFIIISIYKLAEPCGLKLKANILEGPPLSSCISVNLDNVIFKTLWSPSKLTELCIWPIILLNNNHVVSGMCSVARQICKVSENESVRKLLGFREACLVACAESSVWTKFCEIDITVTINKVLNNSFMKNDAFNIPEDVLKFENHLLQPVRIHNIYKIARNNINDQSLNSSTPRKDLRVAHDYAEGPYMTLADLILYPCFLIFFKYSLECNNLFVKPRIPSVTSWFNRMKIADISLLDFSLNCSKKICTNKIIMPEVANVSLYKADPTRTQSINHTKQYKIESALNLVDEMKNEITNNLLPYGYYKEFNWGSIPLAANPQGGALPAKRADRKCKQLENLVKATLAVVGDRKCRIVDFCSGSGHLGILVALILPNCQIILVENKEQSLARARETILGLNLHNLVVVQSNLDYFVGTFDVGLALHACGVATDLVLQMCIKNRADFVCCPCCYGGVKDCHELSYPRSARFRNVFLRNEAQYFNLAHAADQTHGHENCKTKQGYFCMDIIDSDRKFYAEACGYNVHLGKLQPVTCTNKNNLLVGICSTVCK